MLNGKLTYTGIIVSALGGLNIPAILGVTPAEWNGFISVVMVIVGALAGLYGRYRATRR